MAEEKVDRWAKQKEQIEELEQMPKTEDLDRVEKLLDVFMNTVNMPHMKPIGDACMNELLAICLQLEIDETEAREKIEQEKVEKKAKAEAEAAEKQKKALEAEKAKETKHAA